MTRSVPRTCKATPYSGFFSIDGAAGAARAMALHPCRAASSSMFLLHSIHVGNHRSPTYPHLSPERENSFVLLDREKVEPSSARATTSSFRCRPSCLHLLSMHLNHFLTLFGPIWFPVPSPEALVRVCPAPHRRHQRQHHDHRIFIFAFGLPFRRTLNNQSATFYTTRLDLTEQCQLKISWPLQPARHRIPWSPSCL